MTLPQTRPKRDDKSGIPPPGGIPFRPLPRLEQFGNIRCKIHKRYPYTTGKKEGVLVTG